jgi:hypothetical protein
VATGCSWADATYLPRAVAQFPHFSSQSLDSAGLIDFADTVGVGCQHRIQLAPLDFA